MNSVGEFFFVFFGKIHGIDGGKIFHVNGGALNLRELVFEDFTGIGNTYGNDGATGFLRNLETSGMELKERVGAFVACAFGEDADAGAFFDKLDTSVNHLKAAA